jgi:hypothetical protein
MKSLCGQRYVTFIFLGATVASTACLTTVSPSEPVEASNDGSAARNDGPVVGQGSQGGRPSASGSSVVDAAPGPSSSPVIDASPTQTDGSPVVDGGDASSVVDAAPSADGSSGVTFPYVGRNVRANLYCRGRAQRRDSDDSMPPGSQGFNSDVVFDIRSQCEGEFLLSPGRVRETGGRDSDSVYFRPSVSPCQAPAYSNFVATTFPSGRTGAPLDSAFYTGRFAALGNAYQRVWSVGTKDFTSTGQGVWTGPIIQNLYSNIGPVVWAPAYLNNVSTGAIVTWGQPRFSGPETEDKTGFGMPIYYGGAWNVDSVSECTLRYDYVP